MKRFICSTFLVLSSSICAADTNVAVGFGQPYGGFLGVKLGYANNQGRYYASLGTYGPIGIGYGIGYDRVAFNDNHSFGLFYGVVAGSGSGDDQTRYIGPMINYQFYTNEFYEKSWLFGFGIGYGESDNDQDPDKESAAALFHIGYQF